MDLILKKNIAFIVSEYPHTVAKFDLFLLFEQYSGYNTVSVKNCLEKLNLTQENNELLSLMALSKVWKHFYIILFYFMLFLFLNLCFLQYSVSVCAYVYDYIYIYIYMCVCVC